MRPAVCASVILAVLACGCGPRAPKSVEIDPALARLVSNDAVALVGIKADAIRSTPLYRNHIARQLEDLAKDNDAGLVRDASELLVVYGGKKAAVFGKNKSSVFELGSKNAPRPGKGGIPAALLEKMRGIPPQNQIWAAGIGSIALVDNAIPSEGNFSNLRKVFSAIESWSAGADLRSGLKAETNGIYRTEADAKLIHDALRALLGFWVLTTPTDAPELMQFYDGIQITQQKNAVRVVADIPADVLDKLMAHLDRLGRSQTR